jgi:hypothetical protein
VEEAQSNVRAVHSECGGRQSEKGKCERTAKIERAAIEEVVDLRVKLNGWLLRI